MAPHFITMIGYIKAAIDMSKWSKRCALVGGNFRVCGGDRPIVMALKQAMLDVFFWVYQ
jgi:hypothetical protein